MKLKRMIAVLLCLVLTVCASPIALAAEDTATVTFWYADGDKIWTAFDLTVADGTAERYGVETVEKDHNGVPVDTVTVLDVMIAAHALYYGDAFTKETASKYFTISGSYITMAFENTSYLSFTVNDVMPHDDTYLTSAWGGGYYTGYACDTARVKDGDRICAFMYQDTSAYMDVLPLFGENEISASPGEAFTLSVSGYSVMPYGCEKQETIDANTKPLAGVTVEMTQDFRTYTAAGTLDNDGKLSVTLPQEGTYYLVVRGKFNDPVLKKELPLIASFCKVVVSEKTQTDPEPTDGKFFPILVYPMIRYADYKLTLGIAVKLHDFSGSGADLLKTHTFEIDLSFLKTLFRK